MKNNIKNHNVAIIFDDLTEFFVMRPAIDDMKKEKIDIDIIVPYDSGYNGLAEHTFQKIEESGYSPKKDTPKDKEYKVLLTPYPHLGIVKRTKFIYHLKYPYGAMSSKPNPVFLPEWKIDYDGIFSFNSYESNFLSAYGTKYHIIPYWKYNNFKRTPSKAEKPNLLILSTFGKDISNIKLFTKSAIQDIKKHYHIISKAHHATHFNSDNDDSFSILKEISDDFYDSNTPLIDLLKTADIVLSDNSGAIFESIYAGIPVALFCKNPNQRKLNQIDTLQYRLVQQGVLPHVSDAKDILPMLQSIKPFISKQTKCKSLLFPNFKNNSPSQFTKVIKEYLRKNPDEDYYKVIHDLLVTERQNILSDVKHHETQIKELEQRIKEQSAIIQDLYNSTSWKITKPLRQFKKSVKKKGVKNG